ncbi:glycosyl hydrolase family 28-related protein [Pseudoduganella sp. SL102]|uniref:glycosyl hydrolase family 28-related protein n=1 Tax=Pseudoduganella sp. SL102 TaxID=2995154 RepID=UPI00248B7D91|nr:glycosyl hydrolase family 28-related protein [Pseudoduganella sp. SL102]WBS05322.1 glycosyl hydrolase family 28-related protein [Pseudoduganella sp. SL102]
MNTQLLQAATLAATLAVSAAQAASTSAYQTMPEDGRAVIAKAKGDGTTDDTAAIQAALDKASNDEQGGVVFLPSGRYRLTRTLTIPLAVRLYGVGPTRPVLVLAPKTPGFQKGVANMVIFTGGDQYRVGKVPMPVPSAVPFDPKNKPVRDANSSTFYSALSNVDFEIGDGNPAAAAVRMHTAQHSNLSHIDFHIGSGLAGVYHVGNVAYNLRFYGGRYGILAEKTSPAWQFTLLDSTFEGQRDAAIREHEAGLTMVNVDIRNTPVGVEIDRGYGDWLWGKDVRFENVSKAALIVSNENNVYTQVGFENAMARNVPVFARFRDSGKALDGKGRDYRIDEFNYGLTLDKLGEPGKFATNYKTSTLPAAAPARNRALRLLPPSKEWVNAKTLGAAGNGTTDDTAALQKAIDTHRVVYLPLGFYVVNDTIRLKPDTVLVGLHPGLTQLLIPNGSPKYQGVDAPRALLESARGGDAIVSGIGLATGEVNPRAVALLWRAGEQSLVDDVRIQGGHGTRLYDGSRADPYKKDARFDTTAHWDRQYPSVWVTDGGGGTFSGIWSPSGYAQSGFHVSNTKTPGHVYELSAEHHVRAEIVLDGVENWEFLAPQTEEEVRDGMDAVSLEIRNSKNILFANYHGYRVTRSLKPMPAAVTIANSSDIRFRNVHVNGESGFSTCDDNGCTTYLRASKYPYENAIRDVTNRLEVREREFAVFDYTGRQKDAPPAQGKVEKLETGFWSIAGAAVDAAGKLYFVDRHWRRIHAYSPERGLEVVRDAPLDPVNLAIDASGNVIVQSSFGPQASVYAFKPGTPGTEVTMLKPTQVKAGSKARVAVPVNFWQNGEFRDQLDPETYEFTTLAEMFARDVALPKAQEYVSPDGSLALPAYRVLRQGPPDHLGWRWSDALNTHGFVSGRIGERVVFTNGSENRTFSGVLGAGGALTDLKQVADRGGESAAVDGAGNVYVANGQVFIYGKDGKQTGRIDVPERPLQLIFGGADRRTLYILTHHSLYSTRI